MRSEIDFLSSSDLYFVTIKLHTALVKTLGSDGFLLPERILERREAS